METFTQTSYTGGFNLLTDDIKIRSDQYTIGHNIRTRFDVVECATAPIDLTPTGENAFTGPLQAIFTVGSELLVVDAGDVKQWKADTSEWVTLSEPSLSATAPSVYTQEFPASTLNYLRTVEAPTNTDADITTDFIQEYAKGVLLQDNASTPIMVVQDASGELVIESVNDNVDKWIKTAPEYVPIGNRMAMLASKMFIVGVDQARIYHSVSGRPIDFMIPVDNAGDPVKDTNGAVIGARGTYHAVDFNSIRAIKDLNNSSLLVGTDYAIYLVELDDSRIMYGEPAFRNTKLFTAGVVNQWSFADLLGDLAFIDYEGVKSFNAVQQISNEGRNSVFTKSVASLFEGVTQAHNDCCAVNFDNYALFAVRTNIGYGVLVYDILNSCFASFDELFTDYTQHVTRFTKVISPEEDKLYCMTDLNRVYQLYPVRPTELPIVEEGEEEPPPFKDNFLPGSIILRSLVPTLKGSDGEILDLSKEHKGVYVRFLTTDALESGVVQVLENKDQQTVDFTKSRDVAYGIGLTNQSTPLMSRTKGMATKLQYVLAWQSEVRIPYIQVITEDKTAEVSNSQRRANDDNG